MLKDFLSRFFGGATSPSQFYWIYVECDRCDEKINAHIDMQNDLSIQYGEKDQENIYFVRKQLIGRERCFQTVEVEMTFDQNRNLIDQKISGGSFITEEEYTAGNGDE